MLPHLWFTDNDYLPQMVWLECKYQQLILKVPPHNLPVAGYRQ